MLRPSDKTMIRKLLFGKVGLILLLVIFVLSAKSAWNVYQKSNYAKENREQAEHELAELQERESVLEKELERLNSPRGLEEEIRQKFDVGREGERLIVLVDAPESKDVGEVAKPGVWERIVDFFVFWK